MSDEQWETACKLLAPGIPNRDGLNIHLLLFTAQNEQQWQTKIVRQRYGQAVKAARALEQFADDVCGLVIPAEPISLALDRLGRCRNAEPATVPHSDLFALWAALRNAAPAIEMAFASMTPRTKAGAQAAGAATKQLTVALARLFQHHTGAKPPVSDKGPFVELVKLMMKAGRGGSPWSGSSVKADLIAWGKAERSSSPRPMLVISREGNATKG